MKVIAIIQVRMGSKRFPGKIMKHVMRKPLLAYLVSQLSFSKRIDKIVVATSIEKDNDIIRSFCTKENIDCFSGSEDNVLERMYLCAKEYDADVIVRICGDSPLIDAEILDDLIDNFTDCDYITNALKPFVPKGLDSEVFSFKTLEKIYLLAKNPEHKEHVTKFIYDNPNIFKIKYHFPSADFYRPDIKLTVDTKSDFLVVKSIMTELYKKYSIKNRIYRNKKIHFSIRDVLDLLDANPSLYLKKISSKNSINLIIRVDGCERFGMGHFNRCLNLAKELKKIKSINILFAIKDYKGFETTLSKLKGFDYIIIPNTVSYDEELLILARKNPSFILTDLDYRSINNEYYSKITSKFRVITIDDMGSNIIPSRAIINESIVPARQKYTLNNKTMLFAGPKYMLLNKDYSILNQKNKKINTNIHKILVSLGGSDPKNNIGKVLRSMSQIQNCITTVVLGSAYNKTEELKNLFPNVKILSNIENMYALMFDSDIMICNGGVTAYEANCIGIPSIIIPQNVEEKGTGEVFENYGSSILLENPTEQTLNSILDLNQDKRKKMSLIGKSLVDGKGIKRSSQIILFILANEFSNT